MSTDPILALEGRVGRLRYLAFFIGATATFYILLFMIVWTAQSLSALHFRGAPSLPDLPQPVAIGLGVLAFCIAVVLFFVSISFATRRFHDMNFSGNWNWLIVVVALVPTAASPILPLPDMALGHMALPLPAPSFLIWHAVMMLVPGTRGRNRFGPRPGIRDDGDIAAVFEDAVGAGRP